MGATSQADADREPRRPARIPWCEPIDGFRAICASLAVIGHTFLASSIMPFDGVLLVLGILVALFFAISSFVLYQPFILADVTRADPPDGRVFYVRRLLRIYPLFFIALTAYLVLFPPLRPETWWGTTRLYLFLQIYGQELNDLKGLPSAWYLCNEVVFYLLMPVMAWGAARWSDRRGLVTVGERLRSHLILGWGMVIVGPFIRTALYALDAPVPPVLPPSHLEFFGLGVVVAAYAVGARHGVRPPSFVLWFRRNSATAYILFLVPVIGLALVALLFGDGSGQWAIGGVQDHARFPLYLVAISLLMFPAALGRRTDGTNRFLSDHRFKFLSSLALHIYLWHQLVLGLMNKWTGGLDRVDVGGRFLTGVVLCLISLAGSILVSWVSLPVTDTLYQRYRSRYGRTSLPSDAMAGAGSRDAGELSPAES